MARTTPQGIEIAPTVHLFRGSPCVRSWSKYKKTERAWALCGLQNPTYATEGKGVNCEFCLQLAEQNAPLSLADRPRIVRSG